MKYEEAKALAEKIKSEWEKHYEVINIENIAKFAKPTRLIKFEDLEFCLAQILRRILP